ncbi:hypothetical protein BDV12DRAFT_33611 [Aspergillus spectabilis]
MDSPSSARSSPSKALNPLSPERMNQQSIPNSPSSVSEALRFQRKPNRGLSDVQAKVAYLNTLSRGGSPGAAGGSSGTAGAAALQRAILGREEAESALTRVSAQLSEAQSRERRISERLESLLEELQSAKERQAHERIVFEKEIRKARKEAFRAGSTLVKTQEELKHVRAEAKGLKEEFQSEREAKEKAEQEVFERAYAIAGLTEELEETKGRLRAAEAKSNALAIERTREQEIKSQRIGRMSLAEGDLALITTPSPRKLKRPADDTDDTAVAPTPKSTGASSIGSSWWRTPWSVDGEEEETPRKKLRLSDPISPRETDGWDMAPATTVRELIENLEDDLRWEKKQRAEAEDTIEFMKVQCMLQACICRQIEAQEQEARAKKKAKAAQEQEAQKKPEEQEQETTEVEENAAEQLSEELLQPEPEGTELPGEEFDEDRINKEERFQDKDKEGELLEEEPHMEGPHEEHHEEVFHQEIPQEEAQEEFGEPLITFSPVTGTFRTIPSPTRPSPQKQVPRPQKSSATKLQSDLEAHPNYASSISRNLTAEAHYPPMTAEPQWQTEDSDADSLDKIDDIHNAKRIPLRAEDGASNRFDTVPGTPINREQALAQIRARRGRTSAMKRSVSANDAGFRAGGLNATPARVARRIPGVQHSDPRGEGVKKSRRDMSAPMRMFR